MVPSMRVIFVCVHAFFKRKVIKLVVSGAAFPFAVAIHATGAEGAGEEVGGTWGHEITDC